MADVKYLSSIECDDGECDQCPEYRHSLLMPERILICDCSCHE